MPDNTTGQNLQQSAPRDSNGRDFELSADERRRRNAEFTKIVISRWHDNGPASGRVLFSAILTKAANGPITPEQAEALLPVLLEVLDEQELQEASDGANDKN